MSHEHHSSNRFPDRIEPIADRVAELQAQREALSGAQPKLLDEALRTMQEQVDALREAEAELVRQRRDLARAHGEAISYQKLLEASSLACLTTGLDRKIVEANGAAEKLLGVSSGGLAGKLMSSLLMGTDRKELRSYMLGLKSQDKQAPIALKLRRESDGAAINVEAVASPLVSGERKAARFRWLLRPVEETVTGDTGQRDVQLLQAHVDTQGELCRLGDAPALLECLSQKAAQLVGTHCFVSVMTPDDKRLVPAAAASRRTNAQAMLDQFKQAKSQSVATNIAEEVLTKQQPCLIARMAPPELDGDVLFKRGAVNMLLVPIRTGDSCLGLLTLLRDNGDEEFVNREVKVLQNLADFAGVILLNHRLQESALQGAGAVSENGAFMYAFCSELQGPMHAITGYASMLQEETQELGHTDMQEDARHIADAAGQINYLLTHLVELARLESGNTKLRQARVPALELLTDVESEVRRLQGMQDFAFGYEDELRLVQVNVDAAWARRAVIKAMTVAQSVSTSFTAAAVCEDQLLVFRFRCQLREESRSGVFAESAKKRSGGMLLDDSTDTVMRLRMMLAQRVSQLIGAKFSMDVASADEAIVGMGFSLIG